MSSKINAISTGVGGLATSADASGILELQTNDTTAVTIDGSQNVSFTGTITGDGSGLTGLPAGYTDADALSLLNASGSAPVYAARAWGNFNGTGTVAIRASGNVTSITDNSTGLFTINLTTALPDANFAAVINAGSGAGTSGDGTAYRNNIAAGSFQIETFNPNGTAAVDYAYVGVAVFR